MPMVSFVSGLKFPYRLYVHNQKPDRLGFMGYINYIWHGSLNVNGVNNFAKFRISRLKGCNSGQHF